MRYPEGHKDAARASIVQVASRLLRREGLAGVSIPALMKQAGLTHGAFYGHFASRDDLVTEAVMAAGHETADRVFADDGGGLDAMLARYLSVEHVRHPEGGCVVAALGTEGRQQPPAIRRAFARVAVGLLRLVQRRLRPDAEPLALDAAALRLASQMVGAVVLARLVDDDVLAEQLLKAARSPPAPEAKGA